MPYALTIGRASEMIVAAATRGRIASLCFQTTCHKAGRSTKYCIGYVAQLLQ